MAKKRKRQRIDTLIDAHVWLRQKARARRDIASAAVFRPGSATQENPYLTYCGMLCGTHRNAYTCLSVMTVCLCHCSCR
jgi:hypothetical protein